MKLKLPKVSAKNAEKVAKAGKAAKKYGGKYGKIGIGAILVAVAKDLADKFNN